MAKNRKAVLAKIQEKIAQIRERIARTDYVCSGTLIKRTKVCGKPGCRCAQDPSARHGPYHEWSRREEGRLVHTVLSPSEAKSLARAIRNYRRVLRLLTLWERESVRAIKQANEDKT